MLGKEYLLHGLNAMSRAHDADFFRSGHNAGAVISAYYLCREIQVEEGVSAILAASIDERWVETELFAPFPDETPEPNLITHILRTVTDSIPITPVRAAGQ